MQVWREKVLTPAEACSDSDDTAHVHKQGHMPTLARPQWDACLTRPPRHSAARGLCASGVLRGSVGQQPRAHSPSSAWLMLSSSREARRDGRGLSFSSLPQEENSRAKSQVSEAGKGHLNGAKCSAAQREIHLPSGPVSEKYRQSRWKTRHPKESPRKDTTLRGYISFLGLL